MTSLGADSGIPFGLGSLCSLSMIRSDLEAEGRIIYINC